MPHAGLGYAGSREPADARPLLRRFAIARHRRAAADRVAAAGDVADAPDRRPVRVLAQRVQREEGLLLRIRPRPGALERQVMGVGGATRRSCSWHRAKIRRLSWNVGYGPDFFRSTAKSGCSTSQPDPPASLCKAEVRARRPKKSLAKSWTGSSSWGAACRSARAASTA